MLSSDKICNTCKKKLEKKNFRIIKRKNWVGFYPQCKSCENLKMKSNYEKNPIPQMLSNAKIRAKKRGLKFNLTNEYLKEIFPKDNKCPITGVDFQFGYKNDNKINKNYAPSLDRIVPSKGYVKGNVMIICDLMNRMKQDSSFDDMEKLFKFYLKQKNKNNF
jgi:hypothetical protein